MPGHAEPVQFPAENQVIRDHRDRGVHDDDGPILQRRVGGESDVEIATRPNGAQRVAGRQRERERSEDRMDSNEEPRHRLRRDAPEAVRRSVPAEDEPPKLSEQACRADADEGEEPVPRIVALPPGSRRGACRGPEPRQGIAAQQRGHRDEEQSQERQCDQHGDGGGTRPQHDGDIRRNRAPLAEEEHREAARGGRRVSLVSVSGSIYRPASRTP